MNMNTNTTIMINGEEVDMDFTTYTYKYGDDIHTFINSIPLTRNDEELKYLEAGILAMPDILQELVDCGVEEPRFEIYNDGSGSLILGKIGEITEEQFIKASDNIFSIRLDFHQQENVEIDFCGGLLQVGRQRLDECS